MLILWGGTLGLWKVWFPLERKIGNIWVINDYDLSLGIIFFKFLVVANKSNVVVILSYLIIPRLLFWPYQQLWSCWLMLLTITLGENLASNLFDKYKVKIVYLEHLIAFIEVQGYYHDVWHCGAVVMVQMTNYVKIFSDHYMIEAWFEM